MKMFLTAVALLLMTLVPAASLAMGSRSPTSATTTDAIEAAKKRPAQEAINRELEREAKFAVQTRDKEFEAARDAAWQTYEQSNKAIETALKDAAHDARLSSAAQLVNILATTINYVAASDVLEVEATTAKALPDKAKQGPPPKVSAVATSRDAMPPAAGVPKSAPSSSSATGVGTPAERPASTNRPRQGVAASSSARAATPPTQAAAVAPVRPDLSTASPTVRQRINKAEEALHFARQNPASDFRRASIPNSLTPAEIKLRDGLAALNGLPPSAADVFEDAMLQRQERALMSAGKDLLTGKVNKARNKLILESAFPTVLSDGTKESRSYQNYLRRELSKHVADFTEMRCHQATGSSCNFVDKLLESPCFGPHGCFGQLQTPAPNQNLSPSVPATR